jgi:heme/copper-type cytochrome/quinol oxidase subunit 3
MKGVHLDSDGGQREKVASILHTTGGLTEEEAHHALEHLPALVLRGVTAEKAAKVAEQVEAVGAKAEVEGLKTYKWPMPYDHNTNPLDIDLTAVNTFILICSSVTMVLALSAVQTGNQFKFRLFLGLTAVIGSCFLSVQIYEYRSLMFNHFYPVSIGKTHHFTPDVSLFASCFFTMTGFHGAHVFGGVVMLTILWVRAMLGWVSGRLPYTATHYSPIELVGLYWHFVNLVWIILFTVVYLI